MEYQHFPVTLEDSAGPTVSKISIAWRQKRNSYFTVVIRSENTRTLTVFRNR